MENSYQWFEDLKKYLISDEDIWESEGVIEIPKDLKNDITPDEVRCYGQDLLYLVIDNSGSMYNNGLENAVVDGLKLVKETVEECKYIQTAITLFGSKLEMRLFEYGVQIDTSYEAKGYKSRLYDAIVESCNNMIYQYDILETEVKVKGFMLLFTDGGENGSEKYSANDVKQAVRELKARDIRFCVAAFEGFDSNKLAEELEVEPILIEDGHCLRKLMRIVSRYDWHQH